MMNLTLKILYQLRLYRIIKWYNQLRGRVPVLVFHRVASDTNSTSEPISVARFREIIDFLKSEYEIKPLSDLIENRGDLRKACFVTFDDATEDFYQNALPILIEKNVPFTQFVPTGVIDDIDPIWTYKLFSIWDSLDKETDVDVDGMSFRLKPSPNIQDVIGCVMKVREMPMQTRSSFLSQVESKVVIKHPIKHMTWEQLSECKKTGEIGSHSVSHPDLKYSDNVEDEIKYSRENLLRKGFKSNYFAYPFGSFDEEILALVSNHYVAGFTTEEKLFSLNKGFLKDHRYKIPRTTILDEKPSRYAFRIVGLLNYLARLVSRIG